MHFKLMKYQLHVINRLFGKAELNNLTKMEENCGISREIAAQSQNFNLISLFEGFGMRVFAEARPSKRTDCELQTMGKKKKKQNQESNYESGSQKSGLQHPHPLLALPSPQGEKLLNGSLRSGQGAWAVNAVCALFPWRIHHPQRHQKQPRRLREVKGIPAAAREGQCPICCH